MPLDSWYCLCCFLFLVVAESEEFVFLFPKPNGQASIALELCDVRGVVAVTAQIREEWERDCRGETEVQIFILEK